MLEVCSVYHRIRLVLLQFLIRSPAHIQDNDQLMVEFSVPQVCSDSVY